VANLIFSFDFYTSFLVIPSLVYGQDYLWIGTEHILLMMEPQPIYAHQIFA
jgi:hypothetical protein